MIEKLEVLETTRGSLGAVTTSTRFTTGALPAPAESEEDAFGDVAKSSESQRVTVARTPNTERYLLASTLVNFRGSRWRVSDRVEERGRTRYVVLLERSA